MVIRRSNKLANLSGLELLILFFRGSQMRNFLNTTFIRERFIPLKCKFWWLFGAFDSLIRMCNWDLTIFSRILIVPPFFSREQRNKIMKRSIKIFVRKKNLGKIKVSIITK